MLCGTLMWKMRSLNGYQQLALSRTYCYVSYCYLTYCYVAVTPIFLLTPTV